MSVTQEITTNSGKILRWDITEESVELENLCGKAGIPLPETMHLEARRKQVMVTSLLHDLLFPGTKLSYEKTGKPSVNNDAFISISHSGNSLVMMRDVLPCGVDIEMVHPRVRKVRHKFLSDAELLVTENADDYQLTQYWTAKEAMFKVSGSDRVFMRSNIFVHNLSASEASAVLKDGTDEITRRIRFRTFGELMLAWTESR